MSIEATFALRSFTNLGSFEISFSHLHGVVDEAMGQISKYRSIPGGPSMRGPS